ncbi:hypothetical protein N781_08955 [Pontibacillus halophilus JSM 076056 = DSM 19796]|uniref:DUF1672 domain-containing protein n=1 Tax=Pontibacillus halophilus JSM 076056 = DSM 19796 TaxID=1385510 RepID=A0A0A5G9K7_9BACI|nr:DUF1672 family protein [Pontibacillus halophilus]KGX89836.1 hypothetical protein N781_08955 [Pontibacillus halophilus JSM 076056 = DSM 19796]
MNITRSILLLIATISLGGCGFLNDEQNVQQDTDSKEAEAIHETDNTYVKVQDYTGNGYNLNNSNQKNKDIALENKHEVEKGVKDYFLSLYKSEVIVHNLVAADDAVTVFVESKEEPNYNTYAIVPIDLTNETVLTDEIWTQEGQVENAIASGLYAMIYRERFSELDELIRTFVKDNPVVGTTEEAKNNVSGSGHETVYYRVSVFSDYVLSLTDEYLSNPDYSGEDWKNYFDVEKLNPKEITFAIELFMADEEASPSQEILDKLVTTIEEATNLPPGEYNIILNDNYVHAASFSGSKGEPLERAIPNPIYKLDSTLR